MKKSTESIYEAMQSLRNAIDYFLDCHDTTEDVEWYFRDAIPHLLEGLKKFGCLCEEGFSCGCGDRVRLADQAMEELDRIDTSSKGKNNAQLIACAPEMLEVLVKSKSLISRMKLSMAVHPDCEEGSEFDDYSSIAQELENEIELLITKATDT